MKFFAAVSLVVATAVGGIAHADSAPLVGPGLRTTPVLTSVAAGDAHTCIVRNETVWCTGANAAGQLGIGSFTRTTAFAETLMAQARSVSAGGNTTCSIRFDDTLWCWGSIDTSLDAANRVLRTNVHTPMQIPIGLVKSVAVGPYHACALQIEGQLWCWGKNRFGQLGNNTTTDSALPVAIPHHAFVAVTVGTDHTCAIDTQKSVWCWGVNAQHRLGLAGHKSRLVPTRVQKISATAIEAGDAFTCVINTVKKLQCWGRNNYGQLGITSGKPRVAPTTVSAKNVLTLAVGYEFACATTQAATTWCWGRNRYGQLANGSNIAKPKPQKIYSSPTMGSLTTIATGTSHVCGLNNINAAMWCWGLGTSGQLGDSASANRTRGTIVWQNGVQLNAIGTDAQARLIVTGDMSCDESRRNTYGIGALGNQCGAEITSDRAIAMNADAVLAVGDLQYEGSSMPDLQRFYDPTWGRLKATTYPLRGNHEYVTNGAAGYVEYFGPLSSSYWTTDAGGWRIIAVDSWCQGLLYAGCSATSPQTQWLTAQLQRAHDEGRCALVAMHHPFVSSGPFATPTVQYLWKASVNGGADLVVTGHDHHYERFAPLSDTGAVATTGGTPLIIAGLGGAPTYSLRETAAGSQATDNREHGFVSLTLTPTGFTSELVNASDGVATDTFTSPCTP